MIYPWDLTETTYFISTQILIWTGKHNYIYIIMWSCPGNMPTYYLGLRDILPDLSGG